MRNGTCSSLKSLLALGVLSMALGWIAPQAGRAAAVEAWRPPAVPLVACDPYFSIWSAADRLAEADTVHWTGKPHRLRSSVSIDGKLFRLMGQEPANCQHWHRSTWRCCPHAHSTPLREKGCGWR